MNFEHTDKRAINDKCSCFNLRKATRAVTQHFDHALDSAGIRSTQFNLLVSLASVSVKTLTEMAEHMVMDRTTLTRNLKPLEKMNLITTVTPKDKRSKAYALTEQGREVVNRAIPLWNDAQKRITGHFGDERFQQFLHQLDEVVRLFNNGR